MLRHSGQYHVPNSTKPSVLTCDMKMPGSLAPKGIHEWSVPPIILNPNEPPSFTSVTSCKIQVKGTIHL
jgi:hypothetical protein